MSYTLISHHDGNLNESMIINTQDSSNPFMYTYVRSRIQRNEFPMFVFTMCDIKKIQTDRHQL